jgi:hypothetical protein
MVFTFVKEIVNNYYVQGRGYLNNCIIYKLYRDNYQIGSFFLKYELCFFTYMSKDYSIQIKNSNFKRSKYDIIEDASLKKIGEFKIPKFVWFSSIFGKLSLNFFKEDEIYYCNKLKTTGILFSEDNPKWSNYCVGLVNTKNCIVYRIILNGHKTVHDRHSLPSSGIIEFGDENPIVVIAGIFLVEQTLIVDDAPDLW